MKPSIGRIVHYRLGETDAQDINRRRHDFMAFTREYTRPDVPGNPGATGHVGHFGNAVKPGDVFPAMIVRIFPGNPHDVANLQVHLDGNDTFWATSRHEGEDRGEWAWPVIPSTPVTNIGVGESQLTDKQLSALVAKIQKKLLQQAARGRSTNIKLDPENPD